MIVAASDSLDIIYFIHRLKTMFFVLAILCGSSMLCNAQVEDGLCIYKMKGSGSLNHPGSPKTNSLPPSFQPVPNSESCIAYGRMKWEDNIEIRVLNSSTDLQVQTKSRARILPALQLHTLSNNIIFLGNETTQFKIMFQKEHNVSISYHRKKYPRRVICPHLETHFNVISCTNGRNMRSECTFTCKENHGPSPMFYQKTNNPKVMQLSKSMPNISSICRRTKGGNAAWRPDAVRWRGPKLKNGIRHSTCMNYDDLAVACYEAYDRAKSAKYQPCDNYPLELLLEIYERNVATSPPFTTPAPSTRPVFTSIPDEIGLRNLNAKERQLILEDLRGSWPNSCLTQLEKIIEEMDGTNVDYESLNVRRRQIKRVSQNLKREFDECVPVILCVYGNNANDCSDSCIIKSTTEKYDPPFCSGFKTRQGIKDCMWCRHTTDSCTTKSFIVC